MAVSVHVHVATAAGRAGGGHPEQGEDREGATDDGGADEPARERVGGAGGGGQRAGACWRPRTGRRRRARRRSRGRSSGTRRPRRRGRPGCRPWRSPRRGRTPCRRRARATASPGRMSVAKCDAAGGRGRAARAAATVMSRPTVAMTRGETWASRCLATTVPTVMASANGRNASPVSRAEKPRTVCRKIEVRKTVPTRMPVTPSITAVPETRALSFQMCGGNSGLAARCSSLRNARQQDRRDAERAPRVRTDHQPWVLGAAERVDEGGEAADDGGGAGQVEVSAALGRVAASLAMTRAADEQGDDADRDVDPEDGLPARPRWSGRRRGGLRRRRRGCRRRPTWRARSCAACRRRWS